jgi:hypothetical protein
VAGQKPAGTPAAAGAEPIEVEMAGTGDDAPAAQREV